MQTTYESARQNLTIRRESVDFEVNVTEKTTQQQEMLELKQLVTGQSRPKVEGIIQQCHDFKPFFKKYQNCKIQQPNHLKNDKIQPKILSIARCQSSKIKEIVQEVDKLVGTDCQTLINKADNCSSMYTLLDACLTTSSSHKLFELEMKKLMEEMSSMPINQNVEMNYQKLHKDTLNGIEILNNSNLQSLRHQNLLLRLSNNIMLMKCQSQRDGRVVKGLANCVYVVMQFRAEAYRTLGQYERLMRDVENWKNYNVLHEIVKRKYVRGSRKKLTQSIDRILFKIKNCSYVKQAYFIEEFQRKISDFEKQLDFIVQNLRNKENYVVLQGYMDKLGTEPDLPQFAEYLICKYWDKQSSRKDKEGN